MNIADELRKLHELHQAGALTEDEFAAAKASILSALPNKNDSPKKNAVPAGKDPAAGAPTPPGNVVTDRVVPGLFVGGMLGAIVAGAAIVSATMIAGRTLTDQQGWILVIVYGFLGAMIGALAFTARRVAGWIAWFTFFGALAGAIAFGPIGIPFLGLLGAAGGAVLAAATGR